MSAINKRQQARNERALQDLISTVPGNNKCADCSASYPGWASWNLGIFLCMRCASLHRKLGTHISKVKSLSMDTWTSEQVDAMRTGGNSLSNKAYNPRNVRPGLPLDPDEVDTAMEKYIRLKYQRRTLADVATVHSNNTGSTASTEDRPPPPPPKPSAKFAPNLRTSSAAYPSPFSSGSSSPASAGRAESKTLPPLPRDAVAQQVHAAPPQQPPQQYIPPQYTSAPIEQQYSGMQTSSGIANPFYRQMSPIAFQQPLEASFQSMNLGQATMTPDMTGNWQQQRPNSTNPFLQAYTPPISPAPYQSRQANIETPTTQHIIQPAPSATNPFMGLTRSRTMPTYQTMPENQAYPPMNGFPAQPHQSQSTNPFYSQSQVTTPAFPQYQNYFPPQDPETWPNNAAIVPDHDQAYQNAPPQPQHQGQAFQGPSDHIAGPPPHAYQQAPQEAFQPIRHDKSSILALYSQPQLAPGRPSQIDLSNRDYAEPEVATIKRRSVTMPIQVSRGLISRSKNPFAALDLSNGSAHVEVIPPMLDGPIDGRQSPDAFRSLSSAYR